MISWAAELCAGWSKACPAILRLEVACITKPIEVQGADKDRLAVDDKGFGMEAGLGETVYAAGFDRVALLPG